MKVLTLLTDLYDSMTGVLSGDFNNYLTNRFFYPLPTTDVDLLQYVDVYMEYFITICQGSPDGRF